MADQHIDPGEPYSLGEAPTQWQENRRGTQTRRECCRQCRHITSLNIVHYFADCQSPLDMATKMFGLNLETAHFWDLQQVGDGDHQFIPLAEKKILLPRERGRGGFIQQNCILLSHIVATTQVHVNSLRCETSLSRVSHLNVLSAPNWCSCDSQ